MADVQKSDISLQERISELEEGHPHEWPPTKMPSAEGWYWYEHRDGDRMVYLVDAECRVSVYTDNEEVVLTLDQFRGEYAGRWLGPAILPRKRTTPEKYPLVCVNTAHKLMCDLWHDWRDWKVVFVSDSHICDSHTRYSGKARDVLAIAIKQSADPDDTYARDLRSLVLEEAM